MVIKAEDAEYLASFTESKAAVIPCAISSAEVEAKERRNNQNLRRIEDIVDDSRTELEDHHDEIAEEISVMNSVDDTRGHLKPEEETRAAITATNRKNKGLLHRIRPRSSKANYARSDFSGSVVTTLTNNDSFVTEVVRSKSLDQMTENLNMPMTGFDDKNKPLFGRPPLYQRTDDSSRRDFIDGPASIARNEKLSVDDGNTSVSIIASVSDCEVAIENCKRPQNDKRFKNASLADCDSGGSSVLMQRHALSGQNHRSNESMITNEQVDTQSKLPLSTTTLVKEPTYKIQNLIEKQRTHRKDNVKFKSLHMSDHDVKDVSLMDCATESSSVASRKRGIFKQNRRVANGGLDAQYVAASSRGLSLVDCATDNSSVMTKKAQRIGAKSSTEKKIERSDARPLPLPPPSQGDKLVDCATDNSVVTKKGGLFGQYRRPRKVAAENDDSCAQSVPPLSTNASSKDESMLQKQYDNDEKSVSLADDLTENSSAVAGNSMAHRPKLLESHEPLQLTRRESNTISKSGSEFPASSALRLEFDDASDLKKGTPDIRLSVNQLKHVASEAAFSNQAAVVQDVKGASYCVAKTLDHEHDQKRTPVSPVSEALKYAKSQTGLLRTKFEEREWNTMDSACDRKDEDVPSQRLNDSLQSNKSSMAGRFSDVASPVGLEWEDCDEFGKGKRQYQHTGYRIYDAIQLLRTRFACDSSSDNTMDKEKRSKQDEYPVEQRNELLVSGNQIQKECHQDPAKDTIAALQSLRRQLNCNVNAEVPATDEYSVRNGYHNMSSNSNRNVMPSGGRLDGFEYFTKTGSERHVTENWEESENNEPFTKAEIRNIEFSPKQAKRNVTSASQESEDSGMVKEESINTASSKRGNAIGALNRLGRKKKGNHDDEESQMMSSFFLGRYASNKQLRKDTKPSTFNAELGGNSNKQFRILKETTQSARAFTGEGIEIVDEGGHLRRLIEQPLEEEDEVSEGDDDENEIEERSIWSAAPKLSRGNKTPTFNTGPKQLRDVQLVLSASSTLELPKHKRNTVIRLATVPGKISYQQVTDTFQKEQINVERKQTQKQLKLAKRAVISGQYMDSLDPCFRVFDPALDACDNFCTQNRSEDSDDEGSIASVSVCDEKPSGDLQQAGKETRFWPLCSRTRIIKAPNRL